jgi:hypothetical protein
MGVPEIFFEHSILKRELEVKWARDIGLNDPDSVSQNAHEILPFNMFAGLLDGQALMVAAVAAWRLPELTFECAVESCLRFISDARSDVRDASRCPFERLCGQLKPPASQVRHRWFGEVSRKALHQCGPRNAHLVREVRDRPRMGNAAVQQSKAFPHNGVTRAREPSCLLFRQAGYIAP